jgi:hypothetical protein
VVVVKVAQGLEVVDQGMVEASVRVGRVAQGWEVQGSGWQQLGMEVVGWGMERATGLVMGMEAVDEEQVRVVTG